MSTVVQEIEQQLSIIVRRLRAPAVLDNGTVVHHSTAVLLHLLATRGPIPTGAVSAAQGVNPSTTSRQVQYAIKLGLVTRTHDPQDRRAYLLNLSDSGRTLLASLNHQQRHSPLRVLDSWPEHDKTELLRLLSQFNAEST